MKAHNDARLDKLPGTERVFKAEDASSGDENWIKEVLGASRLELELKLKVGARVVCTRNMTSRVFNGSRGIVVGWGDGGVPLVRMDGLEDIVRFDVYEYSDSDVVEGTN